MSSVPSIKTENKWGTDGSLCQPAHWALCWSTSHQKTRVGKPLPEESEQEHGDMVMAEAAEQRPPLQKSWPGHARSPPSSPRLQSSVINYITSFWKDKDTLLTFFFSSRKQTYWHTPLTPALGKFRQKNRVSSGHPQLPSEFESAWATGDLSQTHTYTHDRKTDRQRQREW